MAPSSRTLIALTAIVLASAFAPGVHAQPASGAVSVSTSAAGNVYLAGGTVRPDGPVDGDLVAVGGRVIADQPVRGDAMLAGGSVDVRGEIGDDLRTFGGDISIESIVNGELKAGAGNLTLTRSAHIRHGAMIGGGLITLDGKVSGRLDATAQRIVINGEIDGDARLFADRIELGPSARISGSLHHASREFQRADGAAVAGPVTSEEPAQARHERDRDRDDDRRRDSRWQYDAPSWVALVMGFLGLLAAGAVFLLLFPGIAAEAPARVRAAPWMALASGFGVLVGWPVLALLLLFTLIGIPLGIAALALYPLLLLVGYLCGALFVAERAQQALGRDKASGLAGRLAVLAVALLLLMLLASLPFVGPLIVFITTIAGIGSCVLVWHQRRQVPALPPA